MTSPPTRVYNTLVVAGGASKCISAVGALDYLSFQGYLDFIVNYAGTSAGALICYLLVIGYTPFQIIHFLCRSNFIEDFQNLNLSGLLDQRGLIHYYVLNEYLEKLTLEKIGYFPTFKDLRLRLGKNLTVVTYNLTLNRVEYLGPETTPDMPVLTALRMTVAVPILFERFFYNNCEYIDGGIVDNFPIDFYDRPGNTILGIDMSLSESTLTRKQNYITYLLRIAMIPYGYFNSRRKIPDSATVIRIDPGVSTFDFSLPIPRRLAIFSQGYQTTKNQMEPPKEEPSEKEPLEKEHLEEEPPKEESPEETELVTNTSLPTKEE